MSHHRALASVRAGASADPGKTLECARRQTLRRATGPYRADVRSAIAEHFGASLVARVVGGHARVVPSLRATGVTGLGNSSPAPELQPPAKPDQAIGEEQANATRHAPSQGNTFVFQPFPTQ